MFNLVQVAFTDESAASCNLAPKIRKWDIICMILVRYCTSCSFSSKDGTEDTKYGTG